MEREVEIQTGKTEKKFTYFCIAGVDHDDCTGGIWGKDRRRAN